MRAWRVIGAIGLGLAALGVVGFLAPAASNLLAVAFQSDLQARLDESAALARWAGMKAGVSAKAAGVITPWTVTEVVRAEMRAGSGPRDLGSGEPVFRIEISAIELSQVVVEGVEPEHLAKGPGHYPSTPFPGETGNCCVAGHRVTFGHPFRRLDELQPGDDIRLSVGEASWVYLVDSVTATDTADRGPLRPVEDEAVLTLTTCHPPHSSTQRLAVRASLVGTERPTL